MLLNQNLLNKALQKSQKFHLKLLFMNMLHVMDAKRIQLQDSGINVLFATTLIFVRSVKAKENILMPLSKLDIHHKFLQF